MRLTSCATAGRWIAGGGLPRHGRRRPAQPGDRSRAVLFVRSDTGGYVAAAEEVGRDHPERRGMLPAWVSHSLPTDADALQSTHRSLAAASTWPRSRRSASRATQVLVRIVIGMVIGALDRVAASRSDGDYRQLAQALAKRAARVRRGFPARHLRAGQDRSGKRGADRALPGGRPAAAGHPAAARSRR